MHALLHPVTPTPQQATTDPRLHRRLLDTHRQVWVSLLWGHHSFLLGPGVHKVLFVPSKSLFLQSCVSSAGSTAGLMVTSSKRAYAIPRSATPRSPAPVAGHCWPVPPQETLKHSSGSVSVGSPGPDMHKVCVSSPSVLVCMGFDSKLDFIPPTVLLGLLFPGMWGIFFWWDPISPVSSCSPESCNFGVLAGENECMSFYSTILKLQQIICSLPGGSSQPFDWTQVSCIAGGFFYQLSYQENPEV